MKKIRKRIKKSLKIGSLFGVIALIGGAGYYSIINSNLMFEHYLKKHEKEQIDAINIYGESINISSQGSFANTYNLVNTETRRVVSTQKTASTITDGIDVTSLPVGDYLLTSSDEKILTYPSDKELSFYTITRDSVNYLIKVTLSSEYININKTIETLPDNYYDILIDPGHGGEDTGTSSIYTEEQESEINLAIAQKLQTELTNRGYKVAMTRDGDYAPGNNEEYNSCGNGCRIDLSYELHAPLTISLHHNTTGIEGQSGDGLEVYSSVFSNHELAQLIASNFSEFTNLSTKETDYIEDGVFAKEYNFKDEGGIDKLIDYYFMIRETGGVATYAKNDTNPNVDSLIGSEALLLELGYLDNPDKVYSLIDSDYQQKEAMAIADSIDEYLNK